MKVLSVVNQKGGVGKTTTAVTLAGLFAEIGQRVVLVDTDSQGSAAHWGQAALPGVDVLTETDPAALGQLRQATRWDVAVIDTAPNLDAAMLRAALAVADLTVVPTGPSALEVHSLTTTLRERVQPTGARYRVLITRSNPSSKAGAAAWDALHEAGLPVFSTLVRRYQVYEDAAAAGTLVDALPGSYAKAAARDYRRVVEEVQRAWQETPDPQGGPGHGTPGLRAPSGGAHSSPAGGAARSGGDAPPGGAPTAAGSAPAAGEEDAARRCAAARLPGGISPGC